MTYLRQMITLAAQEGINHLQLCHRIGMQLSDFLEPRRNKDVRELIDLAHSYGIKTYVWTHELDKVPEQFYEGGKIAAYGDKFWKWMAERYETLLEALPKVDGIVVTMTETKAPIDDDNFIVSPLTPSQRFSKMAQTIYDVLHSRSKDLILRTFTWIKEDYDWMLEAFDQLPKDIIIMSKVNWGDWYQHFPSNPFIGAVAPHPQIIEYDLVGQYHGDTYTPWVCADFLQQQMQYGITKKAKGVIARVDWSDHVYGSANEFNAVTFAALAKDPFINLNNLWTHWASEKYSPESAPYVISALKRSNDIANLLFFTLSFKIIQFSGSLKSLSYMDGARIMHCLFCRDVQARWRPELVPIANELLNPSTHTVDKVIAEKEKAINLIDASIKDLKRAQSYLTGESYVYLTTLFQRAKVMALSWRWITEAYFRYVLLRTGDNSQYNALNFALDNVLNLSEKVEDCFVEPIYLLQPKNMCDFVNDIRAIIKPPVKWIATTNLPSMRKPLLLDLDNDGLEEVIVNAQDNAVHAFKEPGKEVWNYKTFGLRVWYPNVSDPVMSKINEDGCQEFMIGAADGGLYYFSQSGKLIWEYKTGNGILADPVMVRNAINTPIIICASLDGYLYSLDKEGTLVWKTKLDGVVKSNPLVVESIIYIVTQNGMVKAFSALGNELWHFKLPGQSTGELALHEINGTKLISIASGSVLTCLNLNGTINSIYILSDESENIVIAARYGKFINNDAVLVGTDKGKLYIFNQNGDVILEKDLGNEIRTSVKILKGTPESVLLMGVDNAIVALNTNGEEIWRFTAAHDALIGNDFIINEKEKEIIFTAQDGKLYVLDLKQIWSQRQ